MKMGQMKFQLPAHIKRLSVLFFIRFVYSVSDANDDEGIEQDSEYSEDQKCMETKELDDILEVRIDF